MTAYPDLIAEIDKSPAGPQIAALFDFDGTLIAGYSALSFLREQLRRGRLAPRDVVELTAAIASFGLGRSGFSSLMVASSQFLRGIPEASYFELAETLYREQIARLVYPEARALVQAHLRRGHTVAIVSSATPYQVEPTARDLDIAHVLCTRLEVEDGVFTGGVVRPTCFGQGKVVAAEALAAEHGVDLGKSFFYSDSDDDIELLERVGRPRPLNPGRKLTAIAQRRGWPVRRFESRGRPGIGELARSAAATASVVTSFAAGLPIWALTGSKRDAQNFSLSLFAHTASALIGLKLDVRGEQHLWSHRPAVFIFNHQSKADLIIVASLVRRDVAGVGKKEVRDVPLIGRVLEYAGTVLIDRQDSASAIKAMQPLVEAMRVEGRSVCLAPEGTRTVSPKLAAFKKGAFHLAMQAGVPIVPIVIHNAIDVAPKGDFALRAATVTVDVLPPVDTRSWRRETIDAHVAEVRAMFLKALGQDEAGKPGQSVPTAKRVNTVKVAKELKPHKTTTRTSQRRRPRADK